MTGRITLDQFIFEMMHVPARELSLANLKDLFGRLDLKDALVSEHVHFTGDTYSRNLLCRTPRFDMLVLCWKPGQVTTIHDHAGSLNVTRIFEGDLTSRLFEEAGRPSPGRVLVRQAAEDRLGKGDFACVDWDEIHQLANTSDHDLVTVHVYAKPLKDINVYCPTTGDVEKVTLRYTLEDEFA
ncbi:MAG: cysteine dioxygenase family protein [Planctomycetes bacterium]|nr:cysteine dioxygenase family protein [Planctomycetota bacterium]